MEGQLHEVDSEFELHARFGPDGQQVTLKLFVLGTLFVARCQAISRSTRSTSLQMAIGPPLRPRCDYHCTGGHCSLNRFAMEYRKVGRGGAGNYYSEQDIQDASRRLSEVVLCRFRLATQLQIVSVV